MNIERSESVEPKSISFKSWFLEVLDHVCDINGKSRSAFVAQDVRKQIVATMKVGVLSDYLKRLHPPEKGMEDEDATVELSVNCPSWPAAFLSKHCDECG